MKSILLCSLCLMLFPLVAQEVINFDHYEPLVCAGEIPSDFKRDLANLVEQSRREQNNSNAKNGKLKTEHTERSNYALNNILYSGRILYGDVLTQYVNRVADEALKSEPELRSKLRFYVLKTTEVNAHCFDMGVIFINIGLLSQLEDEAELALIICHEAIHYKNNHHFDAYNRKQELESGRSRLTNSDDKLKNMLRYEKEQELEADKLGLQIFLKSPYAFKEIERTFDMLLYSYLPFDDIVFNRTYFNDKNYKLPTEYFPVTVKEIVSREKVSDVESTHPNVHKRKTMTLRILEDTEPRDGIDYIGSKGEFLTIRRIARCEVAHINLRDGEFIEAFYNAYLMEQVYGKTFYSDKIMAASLYSIAKIKNYAYEKNRKLKMSGVKNASYERPVTPAWERIEGESQAVHHFFYHIPALELNVLAAKKLYGFNTLYNDGYFSLRLNDLVGELMSVHHLSRTSFLTEANIQKTLTDSDSAGHSKAKVIREKESENTKHYYNYAFLDAGNDKYYRSVFNRQEDIQDSLMKRKSDLNAVAFDSEKEEIIKQNGQALNIHKAVFMTPNYSDYTYRYVYTDSINYYYRVQNKRTGPLKEMEIEKNISSYIRKYSAGMNLQIDMIGNNVGKTINTQEFNKFQQLITWSYERFSIGSFDALTFSHERMPVYSEENRYIGFFRITKEYKNTLVRFILLDLQTGDIKTEYRKELFKVSPNGVQMRSVIYEILDHVQQSPDKINGLKTKYNIHD